MGQVVELNRRFLEGYTHFKDEPRVQKLRSDVLKYNRLLRDLGLRDHQVRSVLIRFLAAAQITATTLGTTRQESELENPWSPSLSPCLVDCLEYPGVAWCNSEWPNVYRRFYHLEKEGER